EHGMDPYTLPTLADLFAFAAAYAGALGEQAGKTPRQREHAQRVRFDLELKRVPFRPEVIADGKRPLQAGRLEQAIVDLVRSEKLLDRTTVRSFDHRCGRALRALEPRLTAAALIAETAPTDPAALVRAADAQIYCPDVEFLDQDQVELCHSAGIRVVPWTVNVEADWERLLDWRVDGITTDYPDRLAVFLRSRGITF